MDPSLTQGATEPAYLAVEPRRIIAWLKSFARARLATLIAGALLAIMAGQMFAVIWRKAITIDEIVMIPAAYYHLAVQNFQLVNEHPPLSKIVAGVPLLFVQPEEARPEQINAEPDTLDAKWRYQETFWDNNPERFETLSFWPRAAMIALTFALGILIFKFTRELFGDRAAVIAVALFSLEPTVLAHGRVVQTDVPAALGYVSFFYAFYFYQRDSTWRRAAWLGIAVGIAVLAKFSMLLVGLVLAAFFVFRFFRAQGASWKQIAIHAATILMIVLLLINASYFFRHAALLPADLDWIQTAFPAHARAVTLLVRSLSLLLPKDFVLGIFFQFWHNAAGHYAGLLGMYSQTGWWYYFPVAFALKTTLPFLLLSIGALAWGTYELIVKKDRRFLWLIVPFIIYTIFVLFSHIDIGVRYYLPAYPFLFILGGVCLDRLFKNRRAGAVLAIALLGWIGVEAVRAFPDHMSYMNQLAGDAPHWWYLSDSNVEWGDDLRALATYLQARGEIRVREATLGGYFLLHCYGIERVDAVTDDVDSSTHYTAIGASYLNGSTVPEVTEDNRELSDEERVNIFAAYRHRVPEAIFGDSIYLYREDGQRNR